MSKRYIEVSFSINGLKKSEKFINEEVKRINDKMRSFLQALVDVGVEIYQAHIESADTLSPIRNFNIEKKADDHYAYFKVNDKIALFIEFGTGLAGQGSPHPESNEKGWQYNIGQHIHEDGSWFYPSDDNDPNPYKWHTEDGQVYAWTRCGIPSRPYMYYTANEIQGNVQKIAKEIFK